MKLNPTDSMIPITWPEFANMHPFVPKDQAKGFDILVNKLKSHLSCITGFEIINF